MPIEYKGFKLMVTVEQQSLDNAQGGWRGRFGFWREDESQARICTVSRTETDPAEARQKTLRIAKSIIDAEMVRERSGLPARRQLGKMASSL